jgi:hypothetical protein
MRSQVKVLALALLASALFPVVARAESSSEVIYHEGVAGLESIGPGQLGKSEPKKETETAPNRRHKAHRHVQPTTGEEGPTETAIEPEAEPGSEGSHRSHLAPAGKGGKQPPGGNSATPKRDARPGPKPRTSTPRTGNVPRPNQVDASGSAGGSSPLAPILIAMAVLAALSIAVVLIRERRADSPDGLNPPA